MTSHINGLSTLFDNPMFFLGARTSLRKERLFPLIALVCILGLAILFFVQPGVKAAQSMLIACLTFEAGFLLLAATNETSRLVHQATSSGMLDFHRISPFSRAKSVLGLAVGAPAAWWVASLIVALMGIPHVAGAELSLIGYLKVQVFLALNAFMIHMAVLATGFRSSKFNSNRFAIFMVMAFVFLPLVTGMHRYAPSERPALSIAHLSCMPILTEFFGKGSGHAGFFGLVLPSTLLCFALQSLVIFFLFVIAVRRFSSESSPSLSKPLSLGILMFVLILGLDLGLAVQSAEQGSGEQSNHLMMLSALGLVGAFTAGLLASATSPDSLSHFRALVRSRKNPNRAHHLVPWSDNALNPPVTIAAAALVFLSMAALIILTGNASDFPGLAPQLISPLLLIMQIGYARQAIRLRWPSQDLYYSVFFILIFWGLPAFFAGLMSFGPLRDASEYVVRLSAPTLLMVKRKDIDWPWLLGVIVNSVVVGAIALNVHFSARTLQKQANAK